MKKIKNVLFVDDDKITCFINQSIVEEIEVAENIILLEDEQQALEFLESDCADKNSGEASCPELIFLDVNLSLSNAFDFLEKLQNHLAIDLSKLFIVLLTSSIDSRDQEKASQYGVQDILSKPLTPEKLEAVVRSFHRKYSEV